jgi:toxin ParE1/3/4
MTHTVKILPPARDDLKLIWDYLDDRDPSAANKLIDRIERKFGQIAAHPFSCKEIPEIRPQMRGAVVSPYIVLYVVVHKDIEIVRVLHEAQDILAIMNS